MRALLDTHVFLWWESNPAKLSPKALAFLLNPANTILLSTVCVWEPVSPGEAAVNSQGHQPLGNGPKQQLKPWKGGSSSGMRELLPPFQGLILLFATDPGADA